MVSVGALVAAGRTSDVYEFGSGAVVKVPRPEVPDQWAAVEAELTVAVRTLDVPAPAVIDLTTIDGRTAIVFERVDGRSMWEHMLDDPTCVERLTHELAGIHRRIFAAGPPDGLNGQIDRMRLKLAAAEELTPLERSEAVDLTEQLPRGAALLHGDLHPGNVLMTTDGPVVIDWFDASVGHPVADVIRSSILMRWYGDGAEPMHLPGAQRSIVERMHRAYVEAMADVFDHLGASVATWEALVAAARLSEGAHPDGASLLRSWRNRSSTADSALLEVLSACDGAR